MSYFVQIKAIRETDIGTDLLIHIPEEKIKKQILKYKSNKTVHAELKIDDNRQITADQRKKIFATIKDISLHTGDSPENIRKQLIEDYCISTKQEVFSISNCTIKQARKLINFIMEFVINFDISLTDIGTHRTDDIDTYLYICLKNKKCAVTGQNAMIHFCRGNKVIALSEKIINEIILKGEEEVFKLYKIYGLNLNDEILELINEY